MELSLDQARAALDAQPFSRLLGARLPVFGPDRVELVVPNGAGHRQQNGFAHGGLIGYAADNALTFAAGLVAGGAVLTAGYTIDFVAPADGDELVARAWPVSSGRRLVAARCDVFSRSADGAERLCAVAQGTVARVDRATGAAGEGGDAAP